MKPPQPFVPAPLAPVHTVPPPPDGDIVRLSGEATGTAADIEARQAETRARLRASIRSKS